MPRVGEKFAYEMSWQDELAAAEGTMSTEQVSGDPWLTREQELLAGFLSASEKTRAAANALLEDLRNARKEIAALQARVEQAERERDELAQWKRTLLETAECSEERVMQLARDVAGAEERATVAEARRENNAVIIQALETRCARMERELATERLKVRLYTDTTCPNQPLVDDLDRWRAEANAACKARDGAMRAKTKAEKARDEAREQATVARNERTDVRVELKRTETEVARLREENERLQAKLTERANASLAHVGVEAGYMLKVLAALGSQPGEPALEAAIRVAGQRDAAQEALRRLRVDITDRLGRGTLKRTEEAMLADIDAALRASGGDQGGGDRG